MKRFCRFILAYVLVPFVIVSREASSKTAESDPPETLAPKLMGSQPLPPLPPGAFTIVIIPDSQAYLGAGTKLTPGSTDPVTNPNLEAQVAWITSNRQRENIVFVSHVGDIVDRNRADQWEVAKRHLDRLRGLVPFGLTVGNHDMGVNGDAHLFQSSFPAASFKDYPWYFGCYEHTREDQRVSANNVNSAQIFSAGGVDFIHLSLECNAPDDVLVWANSLLEQHPNRRALITTHMDLGIVEKPKTAAGFRGDPKGRMRWVKVQGDRGNSGEQLWDKLFRKHPNLALIFCGDQSRVTALHLERTADDGHVITSMLSDYMSQPALRLLRFLPKENRVDVLTYEVKGGFLVDETVYVKDRSQHQFTIPHSIAP
jgi:hypothetical protein